MGILDACELHCFSPEVARVFENAVERLFYLDHFRIGGATLPRSRVRARLRLLDVMILRDAERKLRANLDREVKNSTAYTMATIFNCIAESESDLLVDPELNRFIIIKVDRENSVAVASRRLAARSQRYFFAHRPALNRTGGQVKCRVLSAGPRRCLVECYGHDINLTQRELRYTAIPDLREEYHPGEELDCIVTGFDPDKDGLQISVKATQSNPFDGAEQRHPIGSRRYATIAGKYGGGVFCNLPDGTVCMCNYSYQHEDSDFMVGDTVIVLIQRFETEKRQIYGKIMSKW